MSRLRKVPEGKIVQKIVRMRKKIKGPLRLRMVFEAIEDVEGVYVNRGGITARLESKGALETIDGIDMVKEPPWRVK